MIGDCVHNARSALDYVAWRLLGGDLTDRITQFPIYLDPADFNTARWRLTRIVRKRPPVRLGIHPDALIAIKNCQPYVRSDPEANPLWLLQELDARDKHKLLTMTFFFAFGAMFEIHAPAGTRYEARVHRNGLEDGAVIADVQFPPDTPESEVQVKASSLSDVSFEKGIVPIGQRGILAHLDDILSAVKDIVAGFENLLAANPHWLIFF
jgi:hypothetical protein